MTRATTWMALTAAVLGGLSGLAQAPERLTDKEVKALIETVDQARDRFEDQLDGRVKHSIAVEDRTSEPAAFTLVRRWSMVAAVS